MTTVMTVMMNVKRRRRKLGKAHNSKCAAAMKERKQQPMIVAIQLRLKKKMKVQWTSKKIMPKKYHRQPPRLSLRRKNRPRLAENLNNRLARLHPMHSQKMLRQVQAH